MNKAEYERRHNLLREAMGQQGYSCLLVTGSGDHEERGSLRYLTGHSLWDRWAYCVFPLESEPVAVLLTVSQRFYAEALGIVRDVRQHPSPIAEVIRILSEQTQGQKQRMGVVGLDEILRVADYRQLCAELPHLQFEDATALMLAVRAEKSAEEVAAFAETAHIADAGYRRFQELLAPGKTEWELNGEVQQVVFSLGAFDTMPLTLHGQGEPYLHGPRNRPYASGEWLTYSIEIPSQEGYWVELARMFSLGEPAPEIRHQVESLHRAHLAAAKELRPGVRACDVARLVEELLQTDGYHTGIWAGHAIGLDIVESPLLLRTDETVLRENTVVALHPHVLNADNTVGSYVADTLLVTQAGGQPLSEIPLEFFIS